MTKYEMQYEIFNLMKAIYPAAQLNDVEAYIQKLWGKDEQTLTRLYQSWKDIAL